MHSIAIAVATSLAFIAQPASAQTLDWVATIFNSGSNQGLEVRSDSAGNVISSGVSPGSVAFSPGGTWSWVRSGTHVYVYKLDPAREFLWYARVENAGVGSALSVDRYDNVVLGSGSATGGAYVVPAIGAEMYVSDFPAVPALLWKLGPDGSTTWLRKFPATRATINAVSSRSDGSIVAAGRFTGSIELAQPPASRLLSSRGEQDVFVVAVDADGHFLWGQHLGGIGTDRPTAMAMYPDGGVALAGTFAADLAIGDGPSQTSLSNMGGSDAFLVRLGADGAIDRAGSIGGSGQDSILGVDIDPSGMLAVVGAFSGNADLDSGGAMDPRASAGLSDAFASLLHEDGSVAWIQTWGGDKEDSASDVRLGSGKLYVGGHFGGNVDFDGGIGSHPAIALGAEDGFVLRLDRAGNFDQLITLGGVSELPGSDRVYGVGLDSVGALLVTGGFARAVDFDPSEASYVVTAGQFADGFVWKLGDAGALVVQHGIAPQSLSFGQSATLSIGLASTLDVDLDELSMLQDFPASLRIANGNPPEVCGGQLLAVPGDSWFSLVGAHLPAGTSCTLDVEIIAVATGTATIETLPEMFASAQDVWPLAGDKTTLEVSQASSTLEWLVHEPTPSLPGEPVAFGVHVVSDGAFVQEPGGSVILASADSSCAIELPATTCELVFTQPGAHEVMATYSGDANFLPSDASITHEVLRVGTSLQWTVHEPLISLPGQAVSLGVSVIADGEVGPPPQGVVTLASGASSCTIELPSTSCELVFALPGNHEVSAAYAGDTYYLPSGSSTTHEVSQADSSLQWTVHAPLVSLPGQPVSFGVNVVGSGEGQPLPQGVVTLASAESSCMIELPSTSCELVFALPGHHEVSAAYTGDAYYLPSEASTTHEVDRIPASLNWTIHEPSPSLPGQSVSFGVHVVAEGTDLPPPDGAITLVGAESSCTIELPASVCQLVFAQPGEYEVSAEYDGGTTFISSTATTEHEVLAVSDIAVAIEGATPTWPVAASVTFDLRVTNAGPNAAGKVSVAASMSGFESASWQCLAGCQVSGHGDVALASMIPAGEFVLVRALARTPDSADPAISFTASATLGDDAFDGNPANNTATHTGVLVLFTDGFD